MPPHIVDVLLQQRFVQAELLLIDATIFSMSAGEKPPVRASSAKRSRIGFVTRCAE